MMEDIYEKFPPKRKDEFLNWVKLTQPKEDWCAKVYAYIRHHDLKGWHEGLDFIVKWGCPMFACMMAQEGYAEPEWAMKVIENAKTGDPCYAAYNLLIAGLVDHRWVMEIIENNNGGDLYEANSMVRLKYAPQEWFAEHFGNRISNE